MMLWFGGGGGTRNGWGVDETDDLRSLEITQDAFVDPEPPGEVVTVF